MSVTESKPRPWLAGVVLLCVVLATISELPHLHDDVWQDEAATLMVFAAHGVGEAFRNYSMPNNHMLFSATLSLWWSRGDSVMHARLLPALVWWVATALMVVTGRRQLGWPATALAVALWSGSALVAAFQFGLRGYAFSWPFTLVLFAACQRFIVDGERRAAPLIACAGIASIAILPSNVMVLAVCVGAALLRAVLAQGALRARHLLYSAIAAGLGLLGVLVYLPHRAELQQHMHNGFSHWSAVEVVSHWLLASSAPYWPLAPLLVFGAWRLVRGAEVDRRDGQAALALLASLALVMPFAVLSSPTPLVPRALVPLLPLWCLAMGGVLAPAVSALAQRARWAVLPALAGVALLCFALGRVMPACDGANWRFPVGDDLCHQYYRQDYRPDALLRAIDTQFGGEAVLVEPGTLWPLAFVQWNHGLRHARVRDVGQWPRGPYAPRPALLVSDTPAHGLALLARVTAARPRALAQVLDSGVLKLYAVRWQ